MVWWSFLPIAVTFFGGMGFDFIASCHPLPPKVHGVLDESRREDIGMTS
jgi:hypothetical protein